MSQTIFRYRGYEMRSHSETVWARFMDALRVRWIYEPQAIETRHGWYLPDFYLPACGMYLEVKGPCPSVVEIQKAADAEAKTGCPVVFGHGGAQGGPWFDGVLAYYSRAGAARLSMAEICALVQGRDGIHEYARVLQSRSVERFDGVRMVGDLVAEMIQARMDRAGIEDAKRSIHAPLNQQTEAVHGQSSIAESFAAEFVRRVQAGQAKEAA